MKLAQLRLRRFMDKYDWLMIIYSWILTLFGAIFVGHEIGHTQGRNEMKYYKFEYTPRAFASEK